MVQLTFAKPHINYEYREGVCDLCGSLFLSNNAQFSCKFSKQSNSMQRVRLHFLFLLLILSKTWANPKNQMVMVADVCSVVGVNDD